MMNAPSTGARVGAESKTSGLAGVKWPA
jgi:hypothetical protein